MIGCTNMRAGWSSLLGMDVVSNSHDECLMCPACWSTTDRMHDVVPECWSCGCCCDIINPHSFMLMSVE